MIWKYIKNNSSKFLIQFVGSNLNRDRIRGQFEFEFSNYLAQSYCMNLADNMHTYNIYHVSVANT